MHAVAALLLAAIAAGSLVAEYDAGSWAVVLGSVLVGGLGFVAADRLALLFITPLALLMSQLAAPVADRRSLLADRLLETVIGVAVGVVVVLLVRDPQEN